MQGQVFQCIEDINVYIAEVFLLEANNFPVLISRSEAQYRGILRMTRVRIQRCHAYEASI